MIKKLVLILVLLAGFVMANVLSGFAMAPSNGSWVPTGDMSIARVKFAATLLQNAKVLVAEGAQTDYNGPLIPAGDLYDPTSGTWSPTGSLIVPRDTFMNNMVTLQNGNVLVAGGNDAHTSGLDYADAELYDQGTGQWTETGSMNIPRRAASMVLLNDGRVLVATGSSGGNRFVTTSELYDPSTGTWSYAGNLATGRDGASMIKLQDGRVLIAGGEILGNTCDNSPEIFDPATSTWSSAGTMPYKWQGDQQLTLLADGRIFAVGGFCNPLGQNVANSAIYDPATNTWTATAPAPITPVILTFLLNNGKILVRSGSPDGTTPPVNEVYDPATNIWAIGVPLPLGNSVRGVALANGSVLSIGDILGDPNNPANVSPLTEIYTTPLAVTPPTLGIPTWSMNPMVIGTRSTLTVPVSDGSSAATGGEYYIGADPGIGNATAMTYNSGNLTAFIGANISAGVYTVGIRARDAVGNWSSVTIDYLVVYDPSKSSADGHSGDIEPIFATDVLPGLMQTGQHDKEHFAFTVKYQHGQLDPASTVHFDYKTGTHCNNPDKATNCHSTGFDSTSIAWMIINGANSSQATIQGTATLTVDGVTTINPFRVVTTDGTLLNPQVTDQFELVIYAPNANPNTAQALYHLNDELTKGNVIVKS